MVLVKKRLLAQRKHSIIYVWYLHKLILHQYDIWYIDIVGYIHIELLSNNCAVKLFSMITRCYIIEHYNKIYLCFK